MSLFIARLSSNESPRIRLTPNPTDRHSPSRASRPVVGQPTFPASTSTKAPISDARKTIERTIERVPRRTSGEVERQIRAL